MVVILLATLRNRMLLRSESEFQKLKLRPTYTAEFILFPKLLKYCYYVLVRAIDDLVYVSEEIIIKTSGLKA